MSYRVASEPLARGLAATARACLRERGTNRDRSARRRFAGWRLRLADTGLLRRADCFDDLPCELRREARRRWSATWTLLYPDSAGPAARRPVFRTFGRRRCRTQAMAVRSDQF